MLRTRLSVEQKSRVNFEKQLIVCITKLCSIPEIIEKMKAEGMACYDSTIDKWPNNFHKATFEGKSAAKNVLIEENRVIEQKRFIEEKTKQLFYAKLNEAIEMLNQKIPELIMLRGKRTARIACLIEKAAYNKFADYISNDVDAILAVNYTVTEISKLFTGV